MITFILNVLKFTISGVFAFIIVLMGFVVVGYVTDLVSQKINNYLKGRDKE